MKLTKAINFSQASKATGFTLIELLVVVAIIGILSAVGIFAYSGYVSSSEKKAAENTIRQISLAQTEYYSDNQNYWRNTNATNCTPSSSTSGTIVSQLMGGKSILNNDTAFEMCVALDNVDNGFIIQARHKSSSCVLTFRSSTTAITAFNCS